MPTITINGTVCEFEGKKTIIQVANENGVKIPQYCYHEGLSIAASCRICLAEVAAPNPRNDGKIEMIPKLVPTCQTMAADGMEVYSNSEKSQQNQKQVMEYLLINHPLDCPVCDQAGECYLQDYSYEYGNGSSRFEEDKIKNPKKDIGDHILLYSDRCIMCTRCVRFTREVTGTNELCVSGRGANEEIDVFPGQALNNELSGNVVDICPVGALLDKDFLFEQRVWFLKSTPSIDGITASGDNIWLDHNEGRVFRTKPRTNKEVNKWWISDEIRYGWEFIHSDLRLNTVKVKAAQDSIQQGESNWNDAYAKIANGFKYARDISTGKIAVMLSPMLTIEDAYSLASAIKAYDENAIIGLGPVPTEGEDKTFPGGYTIYAEKAPNARGVRRAISKVTGETKVLEADEFVAKVKADSDVRALVLTGNYASEWVTDEIIEIAKSRFTVLIDTLASRLSSEVNVFLPSFSWAEKAGTFENVNNRLQVFEQAINQMENTRSEGQIGLDLAAKLNEGEKQVFDAAKIRDVFGEDFKAQLNFPSSEESPEPELEYVEL